MIRRVAGLVQELHGERARFHPSSQQETRWGLVLRFLGWPCEFATEEYGGCSYEGLGWRCGHRRKR